MTALQSKRRINAVADLSDIKARSLAGEKLTRDEALWLALEAPKKALYDAAADITAKAAPRDFNFCTIINAKSGRCGEDCRWCAQSKHYATGAAVYPLADVTRARRSAQAAKRCGVPRWSLVTSGRKLSAREVREIAVLIRDAASLGLMREDELRALKAAGLRRFHCNLETGPAFFPKVCSTHTQADKIAALRAAKAAGLEICSGALFGMGETMADRAELALLLRELEVPSIPLNFLSPVKGTPLEHQAPLSDDEILTTVALFRFVNPTAYLRFAGGRSRISPAAEREAVRIGVNASIVGELLTTRGSPLEHDRALAAEAGYRL
jgi:adenosylmethionine-8-amino-7-oxononanoate aminotransferase